MRMKWLNGQLSIEWMNQDELSHHHMDKNASNSTSGYRRTSHLLIVVTNDTLYDTAPPGGERGISD